MKGSCMYNIDFQLHLNWNKSWRMDHPHFHENVEILLSLSDGGEFFIENKLYQIQKGSLFILKEATIHKSILEKKYKRYVFHISPESLKTLSSSQTNFMESLRGAATCTRLSAKALEALLHQLGLLAQPFGDEFGNDLRKFTQLTEFLILVCTHADRVERNIRIVNTSFNKIEPILQYIQNNLDKSLTLDDLSAEFFINKYHLCHTFKSATGFSVTEYIINCRILKARELLRKGCRVQDAGEMVGFRNNSHFITTFGALTGTSPKKYANKFRQGKHVSCNLT